MLGREDLTYIGKSNVNLPTRLSLGPWRQIHLFCLHSMLSHGNIACKGMLSVIPPTQVPPGPSKEVQVESSGHISCEALWLFGLPSQPYKKSISTLVQEMTWLGIRWKIARNKVATQQHSSSNSDGIASLHVNLQIFLRSFKKKHPREKQAILHVLTIKCSADVEPHVRHCRYTKPTISWQRKLRIWVGVTIRQNINVLSMVSSTTETAQPQKSYLQW